MALSNAAYRTGWIILNHINPKADNSFPQTPEPDPNTPFPLDIIFGEGPKSDGGYECIYMHVKNITPEDLQLFKEFAVRVPNTSFCDTVAPGITRLGWF